MDGIPLTKLGADQVDEPTAEGVVAVAGAAIIPERVADNIQGAVQIILPGFPKLKREQTGFGSEDDESLEGIGILEEVGGVTRAVTRALSRATSQSPSAPTPQQSPQQPQLLEKNSTLCRRGGATEDKEPA